jgi:hypothetical protein
MKYSYRAAVPEQPGPLLYRPIVEVELFGMKGSLREVALIDSGADRSMLNKDIAEILGIDLTHATTRRTIGITGMTSVYLTEVEIKLEVGSRKNHLTRRVYRFAVCQCSLSTARQDCVCKIIMLPGQALQPSPWQPTEWTS